MPIQLFFDVETSGLIPKKVHPSDFKEYNNSRMVSIAWVLRDEKFVYSQNYFIVNNGEFGDKIGSEFIHGINKDMVEKFGKPLDTVLDMFVKDMYAADKLVAHNLEFDSKVVSSELFRLGRNGDGQDLLLKDSYCTMLESTDILRIPSRFKSYKWPKLIELHIYLFDNGFNGQHCALEDVNALVRCYYRLQERGQKKLRKIV